MKRKIPAKKVEKWLEGINRGEGGRIDGTGKTVTLARGAEPEMYTELLPDSKRLKTVKLIWQREEQVKRLERKIRGLKTRLARAKRSLAGLIRHHGKPEVKISKR